jgi:hypothetical protein
LRSHDVRQRLSNVHSGINPHYDLRRVVCTCSQLFPSAASSRQKRVLGHALVRPQKAQPFQACLNGPNGAGVLVRDERYRFAGREFLPKLPFLVLAPSLTDTFRKLCAAQRTGIYRFQGIDCSHFELSDTGHLQA